MEQAAELNEGRVIRKIAWRTLPLILLSYFVALVDRGNVSFAAATMNADLGFSETVYGFGAALFFLGYAMFEIPSNLMLARFGARRWLARIMFTWGMIAVLTAFVQNASQFYVMRFALGAAEAGFYPGVMLYLSGWYPGDRRAWAVSRFYIAFPFSTIVMGLIAAPLLALDERMGLHGWQWLLAAEGLPSVLLALLLLVALPDRPERARWLSEAERRWLLDRLSHEAHPADAEERSLRRALLHPAVLLLGLANGLNFTAANGINFSAPRILAQETGLGVAAVGQLIAGGGVTMMLAMLAVGTVTGRTVSGTLMVFAGLMLTAGAGLALLWLGGLPITAMAGLLLFTVASITASMLPLPALSRLLHDQDRAAGFAMNNTISQSFAFCGPLLFGAVADASGGFHLGIALLIPLTACSALTALVLRRRVLQADRPAGG